MLPKCGTILAKSRPKFGQDLADVGQVWQLPSKFKSCLDVGEKIVPDVRKASKIATRGEPRLLCNSEYVKYRVLISRPAGGERPAQALRSVRVEYVPIS